MKQQAIKHLFWAFLALFVGCAPSPEIDLTQANRSAENALIGDWKVIGVTVHDIKVSMSQVTDKPLPIFAFSKNNGFDFLDANGTSVLNRYFGEGVVVNKAVYEILTSEEGTSLVINFHAGTHHVITEVRTIHSQLSGNISLGAPKTYLNGIFNEDDISHETRARNTKYILKKLL